MPSNININPNVNPQVDSAPVASGRFLMLSPVRPAVEPYRQEENHQNSKLPSMFKGRDRDSVKQRLF